MFSERRDHDDDLYDDLDLDSLPDFEYIDEDLFKELHKDRTGRREKAIDREKKRSTNMKRRKERQNKYTSGWDD